MTMRQLTLRINRLNDEQRRLRLIGRSVVANRISAELRLFTHEKTRRQTRKAS